MKSIFVFVVLCFLAVSVHCRICTNNDPSSCTHTCPTGEIKTCEHDVCTCGIKCALADDCPDCPSHTDPSGHTIHETKHCIDSACLCIPEHMFPGGHQGQGNFGGR